MSGSIRRSEKVPKEVGTFHITHDKIAVNFIIANACEVSESHYKEGRDVTTGPGGGLSTDRVKVAGVRVAKFN